MSDLQKKLGEMLDDIRPALQQLTASRVGLGLGWAEILTRAPGGDRGAAVEAINKLAQEAGQAPVTWAEAELLARIATRRPDLADPALVDLDDPDVQQINRELSEVFNGAYERSSQAKPQEAG